jgi:hypothetical protein
MLGIMNPLFVCTNCHSKERLFHEITQQDDKGRVFNCAVRGAQWVERYPGATWVLVKPAPPSQA